VARRLYFRLSTDWADSDWLYELSDSGKLAWVMLLGEAKLSCPQGRITARQPRSLARRWQISPGGVAEMLDAALEDGALVADGDDLVVANWAVYQPTTSTDRVRKWRESFASNEPGETVGQQGETVSPGSNGADQPSEPAESAPSGHPLLIQEGGSATFEPNETVAKRPETHETTREKRTEQNNLPIDSSQGERGPGERGLIPLPASYDPERWTESPSSPFRRAAWVLLATSQRLGVTSPSISEVRRHLAKSSKLQALITHYEAQAERAGMERPEHRACEATTDLGCFAFSNPYRPDDWNGVWAQRMALEREMRTTIEKSAAPVGLMEQARASARGTA
jgi:hypothetical protein